ncbi:hypothetical protein N7527_002868 [Penicillium freii]|nr:hypothetical protein N7527_002868 [Penicillium freii]
MSTAAQQYTHHSVQPNIAEERRFKPFDNPNIWDRYLSSAINLAVVTVNWTKLSSVIDSLFASA